MGYSEATSAIRRRERVAILAPAPPTAPLELLRRTDDDAVRFLQRVATGLGTRAARLGDRAPAVADAALHEIGAAAVAALRSRPIELASDTPTQALEEALDRLSAATADALAQHAPPLATTQIVSIWRALERVRAALHAEAARRPAALSSRELRVVAEVVHDLRSPLSAVLMLSDGLQDAAVERSDRPAARQAALIHGAAAAMHALVSDLRDLARGTSALVEPEPVAFSMAELVDGIRRFVAPVLEERALTLDVSLPPDVRAHGRPTALARVLLNLVLNGLSSAEQGGVVVTVSELVGSWWTIVVRDTGRGLPPAMVARINDGAEPVLIGTAAKHDLAQGLGLSICTTLTRAIGGILRVRASSSAGTLFELRVPES